MARDRATNPDYLNGVPELVVLRLLSSRPMHGYDLVRSIRVSSGDQLDFGEGSIYPILHKLERAGMLTSAKESIAGRQRIIYRVSPAGLARLAESTRSWQAIAEAVNRILHGGEDAQPALA